MSTRSRYIVIDDLRGGRNGFDPPWAIAKNECVDAVNVDWYQSRFAHKRGGGVDITTGFTATTTSLIRHVYGSSEANSQSWAFHASTGNLFINYAFLSVAPDTPDGITDMIGQSVNSKLVLAYNSGAPDANGAYRLHVYDPLTGTVRRTGLRATAAAPTAANGGGAGAYPAVLRYYRQRSTVQSGGVTIRRSEPSASVAFTPGGATLNATVTQATPIGEGETHWEVEASIDGVTFYRIATVVIATTTYADTALVTTYNTNPVSALTGTYSLQKSYRFVAGDQNRLIGYSNYVTTAKQCRVEFSAVVGSLDVSDEERVDTTGNYFVDLDEADSGEPTGISGPMNGAFLVFKFRRTYLLSPTGLVAQPFKVTALSKSIGCVAHKSICMGEDEEGRPAMYWVSHRGPYRYGANGMEYIGHGVEDLVTGQICLKTSFAILPAVLAHSVFYQLKRQAWFWIAIGTSPQTQPRLLIIYDVATGGWSRYVGTRLQTSTCSVMYSSTTSPTNSADLKPYTSCDDGSKTITEWDTTATTDPDGAFQAFVTTRAEYVGSAGHYGISEPAILTAKAASGVTITDTVIGDYGTQTKVATVSLTPAASETRITRVIEESQLTGDLMAFQHQIGDGSAISNTWNLDMLVVPVAPKGEA